MTGQLMAFVAGPGFFRLLLALLVFASHVSNVEIGRPAVMVFFMLSGYWVTRLYDLNRGGDGRFLLERFLRVWPLFAITVLLVWLVYGWAGLPPPGDLATSLLLIGLGSRVGDIIGVSWSLDVEMQFYLLLPLVLLVIRRLGLNVGMLRGLLALAACVAVGAVLLSQGIVTVAAYAPAFAVGAAIWRFRWVPSRSVATLSAAAFVGAALVMAVVPALQTFLLKTESQWWRDMVHLAWCLLLTPFVAWNVHQPSGALDRHLGNLSFPVYLLHPQIIALTIIAVGGATMVAKLVALGVTVVASILLYVAVDRPIDRWRKRGRSAG